MPDPFATFAPHIRFQQHPTETACWIWTGAYDGPTPRYGDTSARRVVYAAFRGAAPPRLTPRCGRRKCVNPNHLEER